MPKTTLKALKGLAGLQFAVGIVGGLGTVLLWGFDQGASFATGAALVLANLLALAWTWWRLIAQKTIAWTALAIVIKYAVLLSSIFYLTREPWFHMAAAGLGIASFTVAALLWALLPNPVTSEEKEKI